ncbi:MAG: hypothetical protein IPK13_06725 [Deltaproteobacteria bacterium]|nr:hypothetical protein [Deltaproteobacteria bacterium]
MMRTWLFPTLAILCAALLGYGAGVEMLAAGMFGFVILLGGAAVLRERRNEPRPLAIRQHAPSTASDTSRVPSEAEEVRTNPNTRATFQFWLLIALCVRVVGAFVFNLTDFNRQVAPDSAWYAIVGRLMAASWHSHIPFSFEGLPSYHPRSIHQLTNAAMAYLGADDLLPVVMGLINACVATLAVACFGRLALVAYGPRAAQITLAFAALWPSHVLWTSINLRESWSFFFLGGALASAQLIRIQGPTMVRCASFVLFLGSLWFIRGYLIPVVVLGLAASYLVIRMKQIPAAVASLAMMGLVCYLLYRAGYLSGELRLESQLEALQRSRTGLLGGGSSYDYADVSTVSGALSYLPRGIVCFLLEPFPWAIKSWREAMACTESFVWYFILVAALRAMWNGLRTDFAHHALPVFVVWALILSYGLIEGNAGTAYRHRAHAALIIFVFASGFYASRFNARTLPSRRSAPAHSATKNRREEPEQLVHNQA